MRLHQPSLPQPRKHRKVKVGEAKALARHAFGKDDAVTIAFVADGAALGQRVQNALFVP